VVRLAHKCMFMRQLRCFFSFSGQERHVNFRLSLLGLILVVSTELDGQGVFGPVNLKRSAVTAGPERQASDHASRLTVACSKIFATEFLVVAAAADLASWLYRYAAGEVSPEGINYFGAALFIAALVSAVAVGFQQFVEIQRQPLHVWLWNGIGAVALAFSLFLSTIFLLKVTAQYSRGAFLFQIVGVCAAVCVTRVFSYFWLQSAIRLGRVEARRVVLIGDEHDQSEFLKFLATNVIRSVASFSFPIDRPRSGSAGGDHKQLTQLGVRHIIKMCRSLVPDDIIILAAKDDVAAAPELARLLSEIPVNIHIVPIGSLNIFGISRIAELGNVRTLEVHRPPLSHMDRAVKRTFDLLVAAAGLMILAPLFGAVAIAIKLDSRGRVFYRQKRHGFNGQVIQVLKFRSMIETGECDDGDEFAQATQDDKRVTRVGRLLRRSNLDELPQLYNVLVGEMSIVGPRPHATAHNQMFEERISPFARRHSMKPGITGWAQVNGYRGETDTLEKMQRRVEHDLYYIDNWSLLLDMKIMLMTLVTKRAYINAY
jgi:Undecaprenyl-phosphate glucose phosphotransferase